MGVGSETSSDDTDSVLDTFPIVRKDDRMRQFHHACRAYERVSSLVRQLP